MNARLCWSMLLLCSPFAPPALAQVAAPEHLLRMAFRPGEPQFFRKTVVARMGPAESPTRCATVTLTVEHGVTGVADGKAEVQQTIRRVVYSSTGDQRTEFDSQTGNGDAVIAGLCGKIIDRAATMKLDDRGRIGDIAGLPDMGPGRSSLFLVMPVPFPDLPVAIGKAWETTAKVAIPDVDDQEAVLVSKLVSVDKGKAVIETEVRIDPDKVMPPVGIKIGKYTETLVVELATGRIIGGSSEIHWSDGDPAGKASENVMTTKVEAIDPPQPKPAGKQVEPVPGSGKG